MYISANTLETGITGCTRSERGVLIPLLSRSSRSSVYRIEIVRTRWTRSVESSYWSSGLARRGQTYSCEISVWRMVWLLFVPPSAAPIPPIQCSKMRIFMCFVVGLLLDALSHVTRKLLRSLKHLKIYTVRSGGATPGRTRSNDLAGSPPPWLKPWLKPWASPA